MAFDAAPGAVTVHSDDRHGAGDGNDLLGTVENVRGSGSDDKILGDNGPEQSSRAWPARRPQGPGGKDLLVGAAGKDKMDGGTASDKCQGGSGNDTAVRCEVTTSVP